MGPEARFETACRRLAKKHGWRYVKMYAEPGFPDRMCIAPTRGRIVFIESKSRTGRLRKKQAECIADLEARGCKVAVVRTIEEFRVALKIKT